MIAHGQTIQEMLASRSRNLLRQILDLTEQFESDPWKSVIVCVPDFFDDLQRD